MDVSRIIGLVFVTLSLVLLSNQMALDPDDTGFMCPLMDSPKTVNEIIVHNITRTMKCVNGREMAGCCVDRFFCNFNTSSTDLSLYGLPGFRMPCTARTDVCCPQKYILPIPLSNQTNTEDTLKDDDSKNSMDSSADSDSDEND